MHAHFPDGTLVAMKRVVPRTCNVCEAMCGMLVTVEDGRITDMRGDPEDPFSRGHICPKGPAMREVLEDPDRLRHPVRRTATGWQRISWDEALGESARRLRDLQQRHGKNAVGVYLGNPTVHNHGTAIMAQGFIRALGSKNRFDANSMDANPKLFASMLMLGDATALPVPDVDRTEYLLVLGANPAASHGSLMTLGDVRGRLKGIRERGGKIVLLDPRRTEFASWASEHLFIRPGGDAAFLLGFLHVLFSEGRVDEIAVARQAAGLAEVRALAQRFPPERVAAACGVPAAEIRRLAREFSDQRRAAIYGRVGTTVNEFGCSAAWLIEVINVVTGRLDRDGGVMFTTPAVDLGAIARVFGLSRWGRWRSRVRGLPEFGGQLPCAVMAEEMETPGEGQIRGFVTIAGNPVSSAPNVERLDRAFASLDFYVAVDFFINETTRHAHIILPPRHALEHEHIDVVLAALAVRNVVKYDEPVVEPAPDTRDDWEILYDLGMRLGEMGFGPPLLNRAAKLAWRAGLKLSPERIVDLALRIGPHKLSLARVKRAPHGMDLGPLRAGELERKLRTPSRKVELAPRPLLDDVPRLERWIDERGAGRGPALVLIGRRHARTNNSWMHNCPSLVKGPDRSALLMHPDDARRAGVGAGERVRVKSRVGQVTASVEITDAIMPGVVSLPHGYGHAPAAETMRVAGALPGPNINALTDDDLVEPVLGTAILNGVPVEVEACMSSSSAVRASSGT
jgi:anaerobic selenocysteine-containing dehydrogenase